MMTIRENMTAVLYGQQPDFYGDFMDAVAILPDPALMSGFGEQNGKEYKDSWGTTWIFLPGAPGPHPHVTEENAVIKDIENWEEKLTVPETEGLDWEQAKASADAIDRKEMFVGLMMAGGLFERTHHLMGMENALCAYITNPEEMAGLLRAIADYKIAYIREAVRQVHPDVIFYHDDWGSKRNVFLPPDVWRKMIKPLQKEIAEVIHSYGMLYIHHADCYCQPLVLDMLDIGVDIWQGTIPQNDIVEIQRITKGKLPMIGGIDGPMLDVAGISESEIRAEVRRAFDEYCSGGPFFPCVPNGECFIHWINDVVLDELDKYGHIYAQKHPVH